MNLVAVAPAASDRERMLAKLYPPGMDFGEFGVGRTDEEWAAFRSYWESSVDVPGRGCADGPSHHHQLRLCQAVRSL